MVIPRACFFVFTFSRLQGVEGVLCGLTLCDWPLNNVDRLTCCLSRELAVDTIFSQRWSSDNLLGQVKDIVPAQLTANAANPAASSTNIL